MSSSSQFAAVLPIVFIALVLWLIHRIRYVIDDQYVRVVLVGITLRKVALADIEAVDTKAPWWNEHWCNTLWACGRVVRLRRRSGCVRNFIITPKNRDELTTYVARKKGFVSIARDHFNVLELLALTPVGFLVILHFVGHEDLGQSRFTGVTKLKFEIIVAQQRGLMAEQGQEVVGPTADGDPLYVLAEKIIARVRQIEFGGDGESSGAMWFKRSDPMTAPDGAMFNAQRLDFEINGSVSEET